MCQLIVVWVTWAKDKSEAKAGKEQKPSPNKKKKRLQEPLETRPVGLTSILGD